MEALVERIPSDETLRRIAGAITLVPGDIIEFGVFRGQTSVRLCEMAALFNRTYWAVDSFRGMPEPTEMDAGPDGEQHYPKGKFDVGGSAPLKGLLERIGPHRIVEGFVPEVLNSISRDARFAMAYVDLDHYQATAEALSWVWGRMAPGGIVLCDDWFPGRTWAASLAIDRFREMVPCEVYGEWPRQVALRKPMV